MDQILSKWFADQNAVTKSTLKEVVERKLQSSSPPKRQAIRREVMWRGSIDQPPVYVMVESFC